MTLSIGRLYTASVALNRLQSVDVGLHRQDDSAITAAIGTFFVIGQNGESALENDVVINVAGLLREPVGSRRVYRLHLDAFPLDEEALAEDITGDVKLTRLRDAIMARAAIRGGVELECARCLRLYGQGFATEFTGEFCQTVDVRTGHDLGIALTDDDERFMIDENHELDLGEILRQEILVALPMRADCGERCPGPDLTEVGETDSIDDRLAALSNLLDEDASTR